MGRNGSGKSSLLWALQGSGRRDGGGRVAVDGRRPAPDPAAADGRARWSGWCRRPPPTCSTSRPSTTSAPPPTRQAGARAGTCRALLDRLAPGIDGDRHPRDLSEGQRLALVLAIVLTARPAVLALDEPTRGLDYAAKAALAGIVRRPRREGRGVLVATHDVEFVAQVADQVVVMAGGEVVSAGPDRPGAGRVAGLRPADVEDPRRRLADRRPGAGGARVSLRDPHAPRAPAPTRRPPPAAAGRRSPRSWRWRRWPG